MDTMDTEIRGPVMPVETPTLATAAWSEMAEERAWRDMYEAVPTEFARRFGVTMERAAGLDMFLCRGIPFRHFNAVFGLGLTEPATEAGIDAVLELFGREGIDAFQLHCTPVSAPAALPGWLAARGLRVVSGWDRIARGAEPLPELEPEADDADYTIVKVTSESAPEWSAFLDGLYRLPTSPWLQALAARDGWHHYMLRRGGHLAAVRSMFIGADGTAWLGVEAPIPGIMIPSFDLDRRLSRAIVEDGLRLGATGFILDIEIPSPAMDTPPYRNFAALGFRKLYTRSNWGR